MLDVGCWMFDVHGQCLSNIQHPASNIQTIMTPILATALISMPLLIKCAIFGGVACGAWLLLDILSKKKPRAESRLEDIRDPSRRRSEMARGVTKRSARLGRLLERATPKMARALQPKPPEDVRKLLAELHHA